MITLLKKSFYKESVWRNGKGRTHQIAIFPDDSSVSANDFLWRISSAKISHSDPFSHFPNCERQLIVWKGEGILMNGTTLLPHSPIIFSGEENIRCDLINNNSPVVDLGIIYKKDLIKASLKVLIITTPITIEFNEGINFLFLAEEIDCIINGFKLEVGDSLRVENKETIFVSSQLGRSFTFYHFKISGI